MSRMLTCGTRGRAERGRERRSRHPAPRLALDGPPRALRGCSEQHPVGDLHLLRVRAHHVVHRHRLQHLQPLGGAEVLDVHGVAGSVEAAVEPGGAGAKRVGPRRRASTHPRRATHARCSLHSTACDDSVRSHVRCADGARRRGATERARLARSLPARCPRSWLAATRACRSASGGGVAVVSACARPRRRPSAARTANALSTSYPRAARKRSSTVSVALFVKRSGSRVPASRSFRELSFAAFSASLTSGCCADICSSSRSSRVVPGVAPPPQTKSPGWQNHAQRRHCREPYALTARRSRQGQKKIQNSENSSATTEQTTSGGR